MADPVHDSTVPASLRKIAGQYVLVKKLGEGAFGDVYLARHELLGQDFAIKVLKPELCEDETLRQRFLDEARALIRFSHPNVVQIRHVGDHDGRLYIIMDLIRGEPLNEVMRREGPFEEGRALRLMTQLLQGLEAAHAAGIIHRDLKPSNLVVEKKADGTEKILVLDFGLSKLQGVDSHRSVSGSVIGTLAYMSPEQLSGEKNLDGRSDVFAAGLILLEMLQGHHPYPGESGIVVAAKLLRDPVPPMDPKKAAGLQDSTRAALSQSLMRDRDARFSSAIAFAQALEGRGPPSDTSKITTIQEARHELARQDAAKAAAAAKDRAVKSKRTGLVVAAVVLLAGGAAAFFLLGNKGSDEPKKPPTEVGTTHPPQPPPESTKPEPEATKPEATKPGPEATKPETTKPEPEATKPEVHPSPESTKPEPEATKPEATKPEAIKPEVRPPPAPENPTPEVRPPPEPPPESTKPETTKPPEPTTSLTPAQAVAKGDELRTTARWAEARAPYLLALKAEPLNEKALVGAGETFVREADDLARSGKLPEAIRFLDDAIAALSAHYSIIEKMNGVDPDQLRVAVGVSRGYRAELHGEKARWLALSGETAKAAAARKAAAEDFEFAWQSLTRDALRYWELLVRRAKFATMEGRLPDALEDLAITTATNNREVPAHMWIAHAVGVRRMADQAMAKKDKAGAKRRAAEALDIANRGASYQRATFTRDHWLEAARVALVNALVADGAPERIPLQGKISYWVSEAEKRPAPTDEPALRAEAKLAAAQAAKEIVDGLVLQDRSKAEEAKAAFARAAERAQAAVTANETLAQQGGPLPTPFPYRLLAWARWYAGDQAGTQQASAAADAAGARNPE